MILLKILKSVAPVKRLLFIGFFLGSLFLEIVGVSEESHQLLVVSCGRGGTNYMAKLLQMSGLDVGHECYGDYGRVAWPFTVGGYRYDGVPMEIGEYAHTFHQVRHPLKVIESWMNDVSDIDGIHWLFIRKHIPEIEEEDSLIIHCAKYWYYWNLKAEKISEWRYRIDDFENFVDEFESRLGISVSREAMQSLSKKTNHWADHEHKITWQDLQRELPQELYENIIKMTIRYGYTF